VATTNRRCMTLERQRGGDASPGVERRARRAYLLAPEIPCDPIRLGAIGPSRFPMGTNRLSRVLTRAIYSGAPELSGPGANIENVSIAYLPQNNPPVIRSITVSTQSAGASSQKPAATASTSAAYSITVTDTGESATAAGTSDTGSFARS